MKTIICEKTQVALIPYKKTINDPETRYGFITAINGSVAMVRFWKNSERKLLEDKDHAVMVKNLIIANWTHQNFIDSMFICKMCNINETNPGFLCSECSGLNGSNS